MRPRLDQKLYQERGAIGAAEASSEASIPGLHLLGELYIQIFRIERFEGVST